MFSIRVNTGSGPRDVASEAECGESLPVFAGNPTVEIIRGTLHLYSHGHPKPSESPEFDQDGTALPVRRGQMLCALRVPAWLSCSEFCSFVSAFEEAIVSIRIVRDSSQGCYMVLLLFRDQAAADSFYTNFQGRVFSSLQPDVCSLVFVESVEFDNMVCAPEGQVEMPTCAVCLERLDSTVSGLLTILCNHSFHSRCLTKWNDDTCPICRYIQQPEEVEPPLCQICGKTENLWICLICGNVACGRYEQAHAKVHYEQTKHTYALELGTQPQRVWDYAGDGYVHRLLSNMSDGKLVEISKPTHQSGGRDDEKPEQLMAEYNHILVEQLESQRLYFEERMQQVHREADVRIHDLEEQIREARVQIREHAAREATLEKKLKAAGKHAVVLQQRCDKLEQDRQLGDELSRKLVQREKEVVELQEQVHDLMMFLDTQKAVEQSPQRLELLQGRVVLEAPAQRRMRKKH
eukprot:TRINITY_DN3300_c0_g2_i2.p1 TRINITY_DN3300_c0_g2~~TRINITY_DN3300_c0_g2_i2.p1  ORF type:complete len:463 (+),score=83.69 TRINITY_DN3300_c0_g2_i2:2399-3787(+)